MINLNSIPTSFDSIEDEAIYLWGTVLPKDTQGKWRYSDYPVVKDDKDKFIETWIKIRKANLKHDESKDLISVGFVLRFWLADAKERKSCREKGDKPSTPVGAKVWIFQKRWNNYVTTPETNRGTKALRKCKCGQDVHGPKYDQCTTCLNFDNGRLKGWEAELMRDYLKQNKIDHGKLKGLTPPQSIGVIKQLLSGNKNILLDK